ncbi:hypothetical protein LIER_36403 [Lithospermum erythrorhizon]|uniref:Reverse transcriptase n=1 Tax=Lithospermum erythrorhizon TaxID=34254 RepID=A0AAV3P5D1_LITER
MVAWDFLWEVMNVMGFLERRSPFSLPISACDGSSGRSVKEGKLQVIQNVESLASHICFFADDMFILCRASMETDVCIKNVLIKFGKIAGLSRNLSKSSLYCAGIGAELREEISQVLGIGSDRLLVKYLGVPLITSRLSRRDCSGLVEKIV